MAIKTYQNKLARQLRRLGLHPAIIANLIERDPRPVMDILKEDGLTYRTRQLSKQSLPPEITRQIRKHLAEGEISKLTVPRDLPLDPVEKLNLFHRTVLQQREYVTARQES